MQYIYVDTFRSYLGRVASHTFSDCGDIQREIKIMFIPTMQTCKSASLIKTLLMLKQCCLMPESLRMRHRRRNYNAACMRPA